MEYIHVKWNHSFEEEPVEIYMEIDEARWETRKIEVFSNGKAACASRLQPCNMTELSQEQIPTIEEIESDEQFTPEQIDEQDFELAWCSFCESMSGQ
jgi:hypothetical protein